MKEPTRPNQPRPYEAGRVIDANCQQKKTDYRTAYSAYLIRANSEPCYCDGHDACHRCRDLARLAAKMEELLK